MDMQSACASMLDEIDGALGCIVIDMQTGLAVAAEYRPGSAVDAAAINLVSVISTNMFRGKMIRQFESLLVNVRGGRARRSEFVREVQMTTAATNQFMAAIPGWDDGVFVLVTDKSVSLGLGWMAVHRMIGRMGAADAAASVRNQPYQNPPAVQQPPTRPEPIPASVPASRVEPAPRIEPGVRFPAAPASVPTQPAAMAQPLPPQPSQPAAAPDGPPGTVRVAYRGSYHSVTPAQRVQPVQPDHAVGEQNAVQPPQADQQSPAEAEPRVALGPRMNFMARKPRGARK